ncbi:MAG: ATP-binding protein [Sphingobium sp.]
MASLQGFGERKFPDAGVLATSVGRQWSGVTAELRAHPAGEIPAICPDQMEITVAISGGGTVERRGNGQFQSTKARPGTLWLCPIGVQEDSIRITSQLPEILHLYFDKAQFDRLSAFSSSRIDPGQVSYLADLEDDFLLHSGYRIYEELQQETAGGGLLVDHLASSMLLHVVGQRSSHDQLSRGRPGRLDARGLKRVLDYIEGNLDQTIGLADLAEIACLNPHHFNRAFSAAVGITPHRYLSARRFELAKRMLRDPSVAITEIGSACGFSSHAAFSRAFNRIVGVLPSRFRSHDTTRAPSYQTALPRHDTDRSSVLDGPSQARAQIAGPSDVVRLTASIAHEVNQPLTAISTFGEAILHWLQRPEPNLAEATSLAHHLIADARRASEIVRRIRDMALQRAHSREPISVRRALDDALPTLQSESRSKSVTISFDVPDDLPPVMADSVQLQQVIVNLSVNAMQAMAEAESAVRELTISARECADGIVAFVLTDTGPGIPASHVDHVFDGFFTTKENGMGMGLAICRWIVESHNGRIAATNAESGARFTFTLPAAHPE